MNAQRNSTGASRQLPAECFAVNNGLVHTGPHGKPQILYLTRGERGFSPIYTQADDVPGMVDRLNARLGVSLAQREAMLMGSMFGWNVPAADPSRYDDEGHLAKAPV